MTGVTLLINPISRFTWCSCCALSRRYLTFVGLAEEHKLLIARGGTTMDVAAVIGFATPVEVDEFNELDALPNSAEDTTAATSP